MGGKPTVVESCAVADQVWSLARQRNALGGTRGADQVQFLAHRTVVGVRDDDLGLWWAGGASRRVVPGGFGAPRHLGSRRRSCWP